jgi:hypothetical protein
MAVDVVRGTDAAGYGIGPGGIGGGGVDSGHRFPGAGHLSYQFRKGIALRVRWREQRHSIV